MKSDIREIIIGSVNKLYKEEINDFDITRPKLKSHGNLSSNIALVLSKKLKVQPRKIAEDIVNEFPKKNWLNKIEIAGPGFINFFLTEEAQTEFLKSFLSDDFSLLETKENRKVLIEYVSSNPTGPIHVGHGRGAAYGSALANLLRLTGDEVLEEYYINDRGLQTEVLALSVFLRYQELFNLKILFPNDCYQGEYVKKCAKSAKEYFGDKFQLKESLESLESSDINLILKEAYAKTSNFSELTSFCISYQMNEIKSILSKFKVEHNSWVSEKSLYESSENNTLFEKTLSELKNNNYTYLENDALWFKSKEFGDEKDRVLIRNNQDPTYFASDVAYHKYKFERDFDQLINIWGADHHGYIARLEGALDALNLNSKILKTLIIQFVSLIKSGEQVSMSTRKGEFISLEELIQEVGVEAARFFFLARKSDQSLEFDIDLAKEKTKIILFITSSMLTQEFVAFKKN